MTCLLLLVVADLNAARRSVRVDFGAWGPARSFEFDNALCPMHSSASALDYNYFVADSFVFQNDVFPDPYLARMYCQDIPAYEDGMDVYEYLNSEIIPSDEAGLAAKIGVNQDGHVSAVRYTFLDGNEFDEDTTGYQWGFYRFTGGTLIVALYGDLPVQADDFSPHIYHETLDTSELFWSAASAGFEGQYFCFNLTGGKPEFIGFWDGEYAGTEPADGCSLDYVSSRDSLVALYNSTGGENWINKENWLIGDPCENDWAGVLCGKAGEYCDAIEDELDPWEPGDLCYGPLPDIMGVYLGGNNLVGTIPPVFGRNNLSEFLELYLGGNQLSGNIPPGLGNLTTLEIIDLLGNQLTGMVPAELCNLTNIWDLDVGYNRLQNPAVPLCDLQDVGATQTVPPLGLVVTTAEAPIIELSWNAIEYTGDTGRYRAWYSTSPDGPFVDGGATASKSETSLTIEGVEPHTIYYIVIRTETDAHPGNPNDLVSEDSELLRVLFENVFTNGFE